LGVVFFAIVSNSVAMRASVLGSRPSIARAAPSPPSGRSMATPSRWRAPCRRVCVRRRSCRMDHARSFGRARARLKCGCRVRRAATPQSCD